MLRTSIVLQKILFWTVIFIGSVSLRAQDLQLEVASFSLEENSLTAKNEPVYDNNNQKCALVIIKGMGVEKLRFNTGNSFIEVEEKNVDGERAYLMWIPEGVVKVIITSEAKSFEPLEYFFNPRVKKAETYLMNLKLEKSKSVIRKQFLEFVIEPQSASIEVNNELWTVSNGVAYRQLPKGKYQFQVKAKDYHTETGIVDFTDLSSKKSISITLKPNFGWLSIIPNVSNITIFIDDELYSGNPNKIKLSSGSHTIKVAKELYQTYSHNIEIQDNKEIPLTIELKPNFSDITISVTNGADIYIDDKQVGKDIWSGKLVVGNYKIELRKINHTTFSETFSVIKTGENMKFEFDELKPILGSVSIESNPVRANVKIDNKDYGTTPILISDIIIGKHNISLALPGYQTKQASFEVLEGYETKVSYNLEKLAPPTPNQTPQIPQVSTPEENDSNNNIINNMVSEEFLTIYSNPSGANAYIDNKYIGVTPCKVKNDKLNHTLQINKNGYSTVNEYVNFSGNLTYNLMRTDEIMIYTYPPGADVYLDNKFVGTSPCIVKRDNKNHSLKVDKKDYFIINETINYDNKKHLIYNLVKIDEKTRKIYDTK